MPDTRPYGLTAGERDAADLTDDVEDLAEDLVDLSGDEIPDDLDVEDLDDLVAATSPDVDYVPFDEHDEAVVVDTEVEDVEDVADAGPGGER